MDLAAFRSEFAGFKPTGEQEHRVGALLNLYARRGLLPDGQAEPLCEVCRHAALCWEEAAPRDVDWARDHGGISVPWVGREYRATGICVVGLNFNNGGGLAEHWRVCADHERSLAAGKQGKNNEFFATGAMSYVLALDLSASGRLQDTWEEPGRRELAGEWERCAFLEAVKCSPVAGRSRPTDAMVGQCPPFLLRQELEILRPRVVLLLGRSEVRDVVRPMLSPIWGECPGSLERDTFRLCDESAELFSCNHPSTGNPELLAGVVGRAPRFVAGAASRQGAPTTRRSLNHR